MHTSTRLKFLELNICTNAMKYTRDVQTTNENKAKQTQNWKKNDTDLNAIHVTSTQPMTTKQNLKTEK